MQTVHVEKLNWMKFVVSKGIVHLVLNDRMKELKLEVCDSTLYMRFSTGVIKFFSQPLVQDKWPVKIHLS